VADVQKSLNKHDYEIDVVEEILPLHRVSALPLFFPSTQPLIFSHKGPFICI